MCSLFRALGLLPLLATPAVAAQWGEQDERWLDLWTRCRVAVEQNKPVDSSGLLSQGIGWDAGRSAAIWHDPLSIFELRDSREVGYGHLCRVLIKQGHWPADVGELITIIGTFEDERRALIEAGQHEWRPLDRVADYAAAVGPKARNSNNCPVISTVLVSLSRERNFISMTGEQVADPCSGNYPAH